MTRTHNAVNELETLAAGQYQSAWADPAYDAAGNMSSGPKATGIAAGATRVHHVWDAWNRLTAVWQDDGDGTLETGGDDTLLLTCRYDGRHRRIAKTDEAAETTYDYYYNESWQCLEERKDGEPYVQYVWDLRYIDAPVCRFRNTDDDGQTDDETLYYANDANMNVTALVDTSGAVVERYVYDPYGRVTIYDGTWTNEQSAATYANDILYCGYRYDRETGLYQVRYRYYHPGLGRWVSWDGLGYADGLSAYNYVRDNPILFTDHTGEEATYPSGTSVIMVPEGRGSKILTQVLNENGKLVWRWTSKEDFAARVASGAYTAAQKSMYAMMIAEQALRLAHGVFLSWIGSSIIDGFQGLVTMRNIVEVCNAKNDWGSGSKDGEFRRSDHGTVYGKLRGVSHVTVPDDVIGIVKAGISEWGIPLSFEYNAGAELFFKVTCYESNPRVTYWISQTVTVRIGEQKKVIQGTILESGVITNDSVICACCQE